MGGVLVTLSAAAASSTRDVQVTMPGRVDCSNSASTSLDSVVVEMGLLKVVGLLVVVVVVVVDAGTVVLAVVEAGGVGFGVAATVAGFSVVMILVVVGFDVVVVVTGCFVSPTGVDEGLGG